MFLFFIIALFSFSLDAAPEIKWEDQDGCLVSFFILQDNKYTLYKQSLLHKDFIWDGDFSNQYVNFIPEGNMIQTGKGSKHIDFLSFPRSTSIIMNTSEYKKFTTDTINIDLKDIVIICKKMPIKVIKKIYPEETKK